MSNTFLLPGWLMVFSVVKGIAAETCELGNSILAKLLHAKYTRTSMCDLGFTFFFFFKVLFLVLVYFNLWLLLLLPNFWCRNLMCVAWHARAAPYYVFLHKELIAELGLSDDDGVVRGDWWCYKGTHGFWLYLDAVRRKYAVKPTYMWVQ